VILIITRVFFFIFINTTPELNGISSLDFDNLFQNSTGPIYNLLQFVLGFVLENKYLNAFITAVILLWNASLLNMLLIRNSAFEENTYIPAALYVILMSSGADNYYLSSQLLGGSFLLWSLIFLQIHLRYKNSDEKVLSIGCSLAIASLIFIPYGWYLLMALILFLFYSGTVARRYLLATWGFAMVIIISWLPFLFSSYGSLFWNDYLSGLIFFQFENEFLINLGITLSVPILLGLKVSSTNLAGMGMTNIQITMKRVFTWLGLFGILTALFQSNLNTAASGVLIISLSYFLTDHLLNTRKKWIAELTFAGLTLIMLAMLYLNPVY